MSCHDIIFIKSKIITDIKMKKLQHHDQQHLSKRESCPRKLDKSVPQVSKLSHSLEITADISHYRNYQW